MALASIFFTLPLMYVVSDLINSARHQTRFQFSNSKHNLKPYSLIPEILQMATNLDFNFHRTQLCLSNVFKSDFLMSF